MPFYSSIFDEYLETPGQPSFTAYTVYYAARSMQHPQKANYTESEGSRMNAMLQCRLLVKLRTQKYSVRKNKYRYQLHLKLFLPTPLPRPNKCIPDRTPQRAFHTMYKTIDS